MQVFNAMNEMIDTAKWNLRAYGIQFLSFHMVEALTNLTQHIQVVNINGLIVEGVEPRSVAIV